MGPRTNAVCHVWGECARDDDGNGHGHGEVFLRRLPTIDLVFFPFVRNARKR